MPVLRLSTRTRAAGAAVAAYVDALLADLDHDLPLVWGRVVHSVFFGGGTPSLMPPEFIDRFLQGASSAAHGPGCEEHAGDQTRARPSRRSGAIAPRAESLSFGIQSFDDGCLKRLGRIPNAAQADAAVSSPRTAGFDNFNLDLMYALPGQTLAMAERDLERAFALQPTTCRTTSSRWNPTPCSAARPHRPASRRGRQLGHAAHCQAMLAAAGYGQ